MLLIIRVARLHPNRKHLLSKSQRYQSNVFLFLHIPILVFILFYFFSKISKTIFFNVGVFLICLLLMGVSFFELTYFKSVISFIIYIIVAIGILYMYNLDATTFGANSILLFLLYAFLFKFNFTFK